MKFSGGQYLEVCSNGSNLYLNGILGYEDLWDCHKNWPECSPDTNAQMCAEA